MGDDSIGAEVAVTELERRLIDLDERSDLEDVGRRTVHRAAAR